MLDRTHSRMMPQCAVGDYRSSHNGTKSVDRTLTLSHGTSSITCPYLKVGPCPPSQKTYPLDVARHQSFRLHGTRSHPDILSNLQGTFYARLRSNIASATSIPPTSQLNEQFFFTAVVAFDDARGVLKRGAFMCIGGKVGSSKYVSKRKAVRYAVVKLS